MPIPGPRHKRKFAGRAENSRRRLAHVQGFIQERREAWNRGENFFFVIHWAQTGEGLGWTELQPRGNGRGRISYGVLTEHRRKGAASRSALLVARHAFDVLGWFRLEISAFADNVASRAVASKAGFELEGVLRSYGAYQHHQPLLGERYDLAIYGRLRTDG